MKVKPATRTDRWDMLQKVPENKFKRGIFEDLGIKRTRRIQKEWNRLWRDGFIERAGEEWVLTRKGMEKLQELKSRDVN